MMLKKKDDEPTKTKKPESKEEKSRRLARERMTKFNARARLVANLGSASYSFTPGEAEAIVNGCYAAVHRIKAALTMRTKKREDRDAFDF